MSTLDGKLDALLAVAEFSGRLGLSQEEVAFYDALAENEASVRELGDEVLKKIAVELTEKLRRSTTVDWAVRDTSERLRIMAEADPAKVQIPA